MRLEPRGGEKEKDGGEGGATGRAKSDIKKKSKEEREKRERREREKRERREREKREREQPGGKS